MADFRIHNFLCLAYFAVLFWLGVNVLLGENNGRKTTVVKSLHRTLRDLAYLLRTNSAERIAVLAAL